MAVFHRQWGLVICLLVKMEEERVQSNTAVHGATIAAFARGGLWLQALAVLVAGSRPELWQLAKLQGWLEDQSSS